MTQKDLTYLNLFISNKSNVTQTGFTGFDHTTNKFHFLVNFYTLLFIS